MTQADEMPAQTHEDVMNSKVSPLSNENRLQMILTERWIGYTRARQIVNQLKALCDLPRKIRMPNLLITGPTNNGKSMIIEKFRREIIQEQGDATLLSEEKEQIPIVFVQMPSEPLISRFYALLLESINVPMSRSRNLPYLERLTLSIFKQVNVHVIVIDELHNILSGSMQKQHAFLNLLRFLGNELQVSIVGVGTKDAYLAIRSDDQLENRFEPLLLPRWEYDEEYLKLIASYVSMLPLKKSSVMIQPEIAEFILEKSEGTIGEIITLLKKAAQTAIQSGEECITLNVLAKTDYLSPHERRKLYQHELKR